MHYFDADTTKHGIQYLGKFLQTKRDTDSLTCISILQLQEHYYWSHEEHQ